MSSEATASLLSIFPEALNADSPRVSIGQTCSIFIYIFQHKQLGQSCLHVATLVSTLPMSVHIQILSSLNYCGLFCVDCTVTYFLSSSAFILLVFLEGEKIYIYIYNFIFKDIYFLANWTFQSWAFVTENVLLLL